MGEGGFQPSADVGVASREVQRLAEVPSSIARRGVPLDRRAADAAGLIEHAPLDVIERREGRYRRLLAAADVASAAVALLVTLTVLGHDQVRPVVLLALPLVILVAKVRGLY